MIHAIPVAFALAAMNPDAPPNRLADSTSPYLLQHARNPVDWYPWGPEAFAAARERDVPIFLSIGYATCYWCHVMEREVFEDAAIAALMNERLVCVKVDREQRPDLDEIYMTATQLMTRSGGWPMSVFLTPDLEPFYAGTYFGPEDQGGRPGFPTVVEFMSDAWATRRADVLETAGHTARTVRTVLRDAVAEAGRAPLDHGPADRAVRTLSARYDEDWGGFGLEPKFPGGPTLELLLAVHARTGDARLREMVLGTLRGMANGGMHDHLGGGFHRYAVDARWHVPHFEKMLYDQALLLDAYVAGHAATGDPELAHVARGIVRCVREDFTNDGGGFHSAIDAETDAVEGATYAWSRADLARVLEPDALARFDGAFGLAEIPRFPGHAHPDGGAVYRRGTIAELAARRGTAPDDLRAELDAILRRLEAARDERTQPRLDDKVLASWNGLMIGALAEAGRVLDEPAWIATAARAADFVLAHLRDADGALLRTWRDGTAEQPAFHEDHAMLVRGLVRLHRAGGEARFLDAAIDLADRSRTRFHDAEGGGGSFFAAEAPDRIARIKSAADGSMPSGNSVMVHALLELAEATGDATWRERARETLAVFSGSAARTPTGHVHLVHGLERLLAAEGAAPGADSSGASDPGAAEARRVVGLAARVDPPVLRPGGSFTVVVDVAIAPGWHVLAAPVPDPSLRPLRVEVRSTLPVRLDAVRPPEPSDTIPTPASGAPLPVHEGQVRLEVTGRLETGVPDDVERGVLRVLVSAQPCHDARCLAPVERVVELPVRIAR